VVLSRRIFEDTVEQPHTSLAAEQFRRVQIRNKELCEDAWLYIPGGDVHALTLAADTSAHPETGEPAPKPGREPRTKRGDTVKTVFHGATLHNTKIGIINEG
jgi:hypothetical protein